MLKNPTVGAIVFFVRDLGRSVAWYRDALGLEPRTLDGHDGPFALAGAGSVQLVFIPRDEPAGRTPIVVFGLQSGIYEVVESLAAKGVEIVVPVSEAPDGGLSADFRDPDGHILSVYQPGETPA
jgi:catechol 2,3-dioxygenase-like lactoylglutathione lyase family enzyme